MHESFLPGLRRAMRWVFAGVVMVAAVSVNTQAVEPARVVTESAAPMQDPWVPPTLRNGPAAVPTQGEALQAQVERKLRERFVAADTGKTGALTREQAQAAGLGFVVNHFDQIDRQKTGAVRFDDIKAFLRERNVNQAARRE